jgi:SAM-dependent methyltransferase
MARVFMLIRDVLAGRIPLRRLTWGILNRFHLSLHTGNRRFEFERLYLAEDDPYGYARSEYEKSKYRVTLERVLAFAPGRGRALEVGCSIGVFTGMLAASFKRVVALDFSREALRQAAARNAAVANIDYLQGELQSVGLNGRFDAIICSEVLYYIDEKYAETVCRQLEQSLARGGIVCMVEGVAPTGNRLHFAGWDGILQRRFRTLFRTEIAAPPRPYRLVIFGVGPA